MIPAFSPVWKTWKPTSLTPLKRSPKKSTSLPNDAFSLGGLSVVALSATEMPRLPSP